MPAATIDAVVLDAAANVREEDLVEAVRLLAGTPSPAGGERRLAEVAAAWGRREHPGLRWDVDAFPPESANLLSRSELGPPGPELALYGHLDTSLSGDPGRDAPLTGDRDPSPPFRVAPSRQLRGLGLAVAKAPSAAALVAYGAAARALHDHGVPHRLRLLLAAGGTHRALPRDDPRAAQDPLARGMGRGVQRALEGGFRPAAVVNVKGGAPGVLHEEPGAAFLRVRLTGPWFPVMLREGRDPPGGLLPLVAQTVDAIESWRTGFVDGADGRDGQLAREVGIGAVEGGLAYKPDVFPGAVNLHVYAVLLPEDDPHRVARQLQGELRERVRVAGSGVAMDVSVTAWHPGGRTDPSSPLVALARRMWESRFGPGSSDVRGWRGATDGGPLRHAGIDTVRMGVRSRSDPDDPRADVVELDDLLVMAGLYAELGVRYVRESGANDD